MSLSRIRIRDGEALLRTGQPERYGAAVYLAGYALECAMKACICADKKYKCLPTKYWHHDLMALARHTVRWNLAAVGRGMQGRLASVAAEWDVTMRYSVVPYAARDVLQFIATVRELSKEFAPWP